MATFADRTPTAGAPPPLLGRLRLALFGISDAETLPERRGFAVDDPAVGERLARIGATFLVGYRAGLVDPRPARLAAALDRVPVGWRGFAWEGAGFALALVDTIAPRLGRPGRLEELLAGAGAPHVYLVAVGSGWSLARLPKPIDRHLARLDPLVAWLALDGYGFHHGYFRHHEVIDRQAVPRRLTGYRRRGFDQGLGRSLWFVAGADPERIARTMAGFPAERRGDLWSGVGLACAYAGGVERAVVERLARLAGEHRGDLAQGVAFAAKSRVLAADPAPQTELGCEVLWGLSAEATAGVADEVFVERVAPRLADDPRRPATAPGEPLYESWRRGLRERHAERWELAG